MQGACRFLGSRELDIEVGGMENGGNRTEPYSSSQCLVSVASAHKTFERNKTNRVFSLALCTRRHARAVTSTKFDMHVAWNCVILFPDESGTHYRESYLKTMDISIPIPL